MLLSSVTLLTVELQISNSLDDSVLSVLANEVLSVPKLLSVLWYSVDIVLSYSVEPEISVDNTVVCELSEDPDVSSNGVTVD